MCSFNYARNVPWSRDVDKAIGWFRDMGFFQKYMNDPIPIEARQRWAPKQEDALLALDFEHILLPIIFLSTGLGVGMLLFALELSTSLMSVNQKKSKSNGSATRIFNIQIMYL